MDTEGAGAIQAQVVAHNIYPTDSDEEALVDFVKDIVSCTTRLMNILRTKPGKNVFGRGSPTVASCLSKSAGLGSYLKKGSLRQVHTIQV